MGLLQNGKWVDQWYDTKSTNGHFKRTNAQLPVMRGLRPKPGDIICISRTPARGRIAP